MFRNSPPTRSSMMALLLAFAAALPSGGLAQQAARAEAEAAAASHFPADEDVEIMLRYLVEDGETPGVVLALIDEDGSTRVFHHGTAGEGEPPLGPRSLFEIGSITKTFTGTLLADMVQRGEMAYDDPVQKYLPEGVTMPTWDGREITLVDLSTHHSGLPRLPDNFEPADPADPYADYSVEHLYEFLSSHELRREPGSEYEYSNLAAGLLGHVLELASGMSYEDLVRERILEPLDMDMTAITLEGELSEWMATGHDGSGQPVPHWNVLTLAGAGGLRSNAEDMLKYVSAHLVPPDSDLGRAFRATHEERVRVDDDASRGLGWFIRDLGLRRAFLHGGGTAGFSTMVAFDPDLGVGMVFLANTGDFDDDIGLDLLRRGAPLDLGDVDVPEATLERYVGRYQLGGSAMVIRLEDEGWLTMQAPGNVRFRLYAESDTSFYVRRTPWRFAFQADAHGEVTGVVADLEGDEARARKAGDDTPDPRVVAGNATPPALEAAPLSPEEMDVYVGAYALRMGERTLDVRIFVQDGRLMAQASGQNAFPLLNQGDHAFLAEVDPGIRLVFAVEDGRAVGMTLHQNGAEVPGERKPAADGG